MGKPESSGRIQNEIRLYRLQSSPGKVRFRFTVASPFRVGGGWSRNISMSTRKARIGIAPPGFGQLNLACPCMVQVFGSDMSSRRRESSTFLFNQPNSAEFWNSMGIGMRGDCSAATTGMPRSRQYPRAFVNVMVVRGRESKGFQY